jgi:hypothetical protein
VRRILLSFVNDSPSDDVWRSAWPLLLEMICEFGGKLTGRAADGFDEFFLEYLCANWKGIDDADKLTFGEITKRVSYSNERVLGYIIFWSGKPTFVECKSITIHPRSGTKAIVPIWMNCSQVASPSGIIAVLRSLSKSADVPRRFVDLTIRKFVDDDLLLAGFHGELIPELLEKVVPDKDLIRIYDECFAKKDAAKLTNDVQARLLYRVRLGFRSSEGTEFPANFREILLKLNLLHCFWDLKSFDPSALALPEREINRPKISEKLAFVKADHYDVELLDAAVSLNWGDFPNCEVIGSKLFRFRYAEGFSALDLKSSGDVNIIAYRSAVDNITELAAILRSAWRPSYDERIAELLATPGQDDLESIVRAFSPLGLPSWFVKCRVFLVREAQMAATWLMKSRRYFSSRRSPFREFLQKVPYVISFQYKATRMARHYKKVSGYEQASLTCDRSSDALALDSGPTLK